MVLSGMGNMDMMRDNIATMSEFDPLDREELDACDRARALIREANMIGCTGCNYCAELCPSDVRISDIFLAHDRFAAAKITRSEAKREIAERGADPSRCIDCGACERVCPQSIAIRDRLAAVSKKLKLGE